VEPRAKLRALVGGANITDLSSRHATVDDSVGAEGPLTTPVWPQLSFPYASNLRPRA
jgi:hypothetical protein